MDIVIQTGLFIIGFMIGGVWWTWIHEPKKSIIEGLKDWYHESADDF